MDIVMGLIRRCKKNDRRAFDELFSRYESYLYRLCYGFAGGKEEALDIMQEVYLKIFRSLSAFDETRPFLPWLKKITVHTALNYRRDHREHYVVPLNDSLNGPLGSQSEKALSLGETLAAKENVEDEVLYRDSRKIVDNLIKQLPENYRFALTLRYREEMSYEEIAAMLNQPLGTVKNSIFRARTRLREQLKECGIYQ